MTPRSPLLGLRTSNGCARELALLNDALPRCPWLDIAGRPGGASRLTPLEAAGESRNLRRLKREVERRWGTVPLIDMLKEAALRTGRLRTVTVVAGRTDLDHQMLAERMLLCVYAYGTNTGLRAVAAGDHCHPEDDLRYVRRRYLTAEAARRDGDRAGQRHLRRPPAGHLGRGLHRGRK